MTPQSPNPDWGRLVALAQAELRRTLRKLPSRLRDQARTLPVTWEPRPSAALLADGYEPDLLGLFVGPSFAEGESPACDLPPQIILFLENLWDLAEGDEAAYRLETRTTYLHELGHFLGLDELDLEARGLE
jgi:predicted Zn-dependent protease with MMP-like domain